MTESRLESLLPTANQAAGRPPEPASAPEPARDREGAPGRRDSDDIRTLRYGFEALRLASADRGVSSGRVARACGISRPAAYRVLQTLLGEGYLLREGPLKRARYRLSGRVRSLAAGYDGEARLLDVAMPLMLAWTEEFGWPLALSTLVGDRAVVRFTTDPVARRALVRYRASRRAPPLTIPSALVCLAHQPADLLALGECVELEGTVTRAELPQHLARVREDGFALYHAPGLRESTLAIPVAHDGGGVASLAMRYMRVADGGAEERARRLATLQALGARIACMANGNRERHGGI
jgi:IclR family mhp operon transcriptional activator